MLVSHCADGSWPTPKALITLSINSNDSSRKYCNTMTYVDIPSQTLINCGARHFGEPLYARPYTYTTLGSYPDPAPGPPPAPVGAIVGGVIGGVALLVLFVSCIIYCVVTKRKKEKREVEECCTKPASPCTPVANSTCHSSVDHRHSTIRTTPGSLHGYPSTYNNYSPYEGAPPSAHQPTGYVPGFNGAPSERMAAPHSPGFHPIQHGTLTSAELTPSPEPTWGTHYFRGTPEAAEMSSEPIANSNVYEISGEDRWARQA